MHRGRSAFAMVAFWLLMLLVLPQSAWAAAQSGDTTPTVCDSCRIVIDQLEQPTPLSGNWLFTRDDSPANKNVDLDTSDWRLVKTPGRWAGAYDDGQKFHIGWYRGVFEFDPTMVGQEVVVLINA